MMGNYRNTYSKSDIVRATRLRPTHRTLNFNLLNFNLSSGNTNSLNKTFKHNSSKVLFAVVCILFLSYLSQDKKHQMKFTCN